VPLFAFLRNGWRVRPQEANHTLNVSGGVLLVDGGGDPFTNTVGSYTVRINYQQPVQAITVATGGGSAPSATEVAAAVWNYADGVETDLTPLEAVRLLTAVLAGDTELDGNEVSFYAATPGGKVRITATAVQGERQVTTRDPTP
jgi:hypothetical protein